MTREEQIKALEKDWAENPRWTDVERGYSAADVVRLRGSVQPEHTLCQTRRGEAVEAGARRGEEGLRELHRRHHRRPGDAAGQGRRRGHLSLRLAGGRRRQYLRDHVPRPVAVCLRLGPDHGPAHQQHLQARRRDPVVARHRTRRRGLYRLLPAHRGGCGGRLRRRAQRLRADEEHDHRRCRRCAFRGPARRGEEMRPHGRQGAGADPRGGGEADRRPARRRRDGGAHPGAGAHGFRGGQPADQRCRRQRPALPHRRANRGGLLPGQERPGAGHQPRPGLRPLRGSGVVRDRHARISASPASSRKRCWRRTRTSSWPTTARRPSTGRRTWTT